MKIGELKQAIANWNEDFEISVGLDVEDGKIVSSLSIYDPSNDEVTDVMTEEYFISGFSTERN